MENMVAIVCSVLVLGGAFLVIIVALATLEAPYTPMTPDEEYRGLIEDHGLTHEEAVDIVNLNRGG